MPGIFIPFSCQVVKISLENIIIYISRYFRKFSTRNSIQVRSRFCSDSLSRCSSSAFFTFLVSSSSSSCENAQSDVSEPLCSLKYVVVSEFHSIESKWQCEDEAHLQNTALQVILSDSPLPAWILWSWTFLIFSLTSHKLEQRIGSKI